jgi:hypothetical protein
MNENIAFTERCISRLHRMSIADGWFAMSLHEYLVRQGRMIFDAERGLFWVITPKGQLQVAVWMMPIVEAAA